jgi:hypothetical protein
MKLYIPLTKKNDKLKFIKSLKKGDRFIYSSTESGRTYFCEFYNMNGDLHFYKFANINDFLDITCKPNGVGRGTQTMGSIIEKQRLTFMKNVVDIPCKLGLVYKEIFGLLNETDTY